MIHLTLIQLFLALLLCHLLYDLHWQGDYVSAGKRTSNLLLSAHALTWGLLVSAPLLLVGEWSLWKVVFLVATHLVIDWGKARRNWYGLYVDQGLHLLTIIAVLF